MICNPQQRSLLSLLLCWGITNPPVLIGRTFFYGGFQIRRDAWRGCALDYYSVIALPSLSRTVQLLPIFQLAGRLLWFSNTS